MTEALAKLLQLTPRVLFAVWLFGAILLFAPSPLADTLGLSAFRDLHRVWIGPATLGAFVLWVSYAAAKAPQWFSKRLLTRKRRKAILATLANLNEHERRTLGYFVHKGSPTQFLHLHFPPARSLAAKGLLSAASGSGDMFHWPYTVPSFVWDHLALHCLEVIPDLSSDQYKVIFARFAQYQREFILG